MESMHFFRVFSVAGIGQYTETIITPTDNTGPGTRRITVETRSLARPDQLQKRKIRTF